MEMNLIRCEECGAVDWWASIRHWLRWLWPRRVSKPEEFIPPVLRDVDELVATGIWGWAEVVLPESEGGFLEIPKLEKLTDD